MSKFACQVKEGKSKTQGLRSVSSLHREKKSAQPRFNTFEEAGVWAESGECKHPLGVSLCAL